MKKTELDREIELFINRTLLACLKRLSKGETQSNEELLKQINARIAEFLVNFKREFKVVLNTILFEKGNSDILMSGMCLWNNQKDRHVKVEFEHGDFVCMVTVWLLSYD